MAVLILTNLFTMICILVGINACWGLVVARQLYIISDRCREDSALPHSTALDSNKMSIGLTIISTILAISLIVGNIIGAPVLLESLMIYNVFHTFSLALITYNICVFWNRVDGTNKSST